MTEYIYINVIFILESKNDNVTFIAQLMARFFVSGGYGIIRLYGVELFPTTIRTTCLGVCCVFGKFGIVLSLALNV
jgi:hypothetical protein